MQGVSKHGMPVGVGVLQNGMKCLLEQAFHFLMHPTNSA